MQISALRIDSSLISTPQRCFNRGNSQIDKSIAPKFVSCGTLSRAIICSNVKAVASSSSPSVVEQPKGGDVLDRVGMLSQVSGVLGCQWGDEGKGKLVDILAEHFDVVAR